MIYSVERAMLLSEQLRKLATGYSFHLAGHVANIDFWVDEIVAALKVVDEHKNRFNRLYEAQKQWIEKHGVVIEGYCPICQGKCELSTGPQKPQLPKNRHTNHLRDCRKELVNASYSFLIRCYKTSLLDYMELKSFCDKIGTGIEPSDLE